MKNLNQNMRFKTLKRNKNSILYVSVLKGLESNLITSQVRATQIIPSSGIYLYVRDNSNWLNCTKHYFRKEKTKGVYTGTVRSDEGDTFMILQFLNGDEVLNILEFKIGYKPNMKAIAQMVESLTE